MIRARLSTRSFVFEAFAEDKVGALILLQVAWDENHLAQYPEALSFREFFEASGRGQKAVGIDTCQIEYHDFQLGTVLRDGEVIR